MIDVHKFLFKLSFGIVGFAIGGLPLAALMYTGSAVFLDISLSALGRDTFVNTLINFARDPLVIDLDGDGIELTALGDRATGSQVFFDYDGDGFAERTGWVRPDDAILIRDRNGNGQVDGAGEIFGSATVDGVDVLALLDDNGDGRIDAADAAFGELRVWRDLDGDGVVDAGEMQTLAEAGIASLDLVRTDVTGQNAGHDRGFSIVVNRTNATTTTAESIYFQTDRQSTRADNTPNFTPAAGVDKLPQLPGSGQINSMAWKLTQDATFRADWTALTDGAANDNGGTAKRALAAAA